MKYKYLGWIAAVVLSALFIACAKDETAIPDPGPEPDTEPSYDPDTERGWYDAPYIRYEAEPGFCSSNGSFLAPSDRIPDVQSEATNQTALSLAAPGDWVEWTCQKAAEGMVIRFSIPDAPEGGGTKGILALYVDGEKIRDIELDSYHAWQYKKPGAGPYLWYFDNTPAPDKYARMQYDDKRVLLEEKIPAGATFRLVKEDAGAGPYTIDFVELERSVYGGKRTAVYYCHPYTSCERGSNERINRDIRRQFPKGTDFSKVSERRVQGVARWVNAYPRELFGFATPAEAFATAVASL